jgi:HD superfamily phosphohydrolase
MEHKTSMRAANHKIQRIRDPLHDLVEFRTEDHLEDLLWKVVQTRPFQRLRRVKQLGFSELVYPGATHSRFAHSIGAFHLARSLMKIVKKFDPSNNPREGYAIAAALVHDVGHGPFSHTFESVGERLQFELVSDHENVTEKLVRQGEISDVLRELGTGAADDIADIIRKRGRKTVHNAVVSSQFDADRLDYMQRDRLMTGTKHSAIDFTWLIANLELGEVKTGVDKSDAGSVTTFILNHKAAQAAEAYVLGLFQLYQTVYFHKATRSAQAIFTELLSQVIKLVRDSSSTMTGLPDIHPIVQFAQQPENIDRVQQLDDTTIWGALPLMMNANPSVPLVREFAQRLHERNLYKSYDIRTEVERHFRDQHSGNGGGGRRLFIDDDEIGQEIDRKCIQIKDKLMQWHREHCDETVESVPRILIDAGASTPTHKFPESA